jgi:WD40 repeat protein/tetratricopeptide (TPR) repeat protein
MSWSDVYEGRLAWADYLSGQKALAEQAHPSHASNMAHSAELAPPVQPAQLESPPEEAHGDEASLKLSLNKQDYRAALTGGLGALRNPVRNAVREKLHTLEFNLGLLAGGVAQLGADFTPLLGDIVWKLEMQHSAVLDVLQEIRLAEFEREARAYRTRAERAYLNGWYEEALRDYLKAEKRNYPDYVVLRSIANIYLYHLVNLPKARAYFHKAAKYARPNDAQQAAEAHYFAALVCLIEQQSDKSDKRLAGGEWTVEALRELEEAIKLQPQFSEAHYQHAAVSALVGLAEEAIGSLERAIAGDARYYERAKTDTVFDTIRSQVEALLDRLVQPVWERAEQLKQDAAQLQGYVIADAEREKLDSVLRQAEQQQSADLTYRDRLRMLERITAFQEELQHIHERFDRHYVIDPRDYVRSIAFSHDGQWLAAGFLHGGVQLWEVDSMLQLRAFRGHQGGGHYGSVNSVAFSPNDARLVTGGRDNTVRLWEADTGGEVCVLRGHTEEVHAATFSPDGQWLVSGSHDKTIRIWRAITGHEVDTLRGHTRPVTSVVFTPDGRLLASGSWDHTIRIWEMKSGQYATVLTGHSKGVSALTISPDGRYLASGAEGGEVKLWDLETGRQVRCFTGLRNGVMSVAFSPDGQLLAAGCLGVRVVVWKAATGEVVRQLFYDDISYNSVAFSPRGQWLALGSRDLQLWLKAILTEEEYAAVKAGEQRAVRAAQEEKLLTGYVFSLNR